MIGSGAYGTVYKATDRHNEGQFVALKKIRIPMTEIGVPVSILREISVLKQLQTFDHPNVVKWVSSSNKVIFFFAQFKFRFKFQFKLIIDF